MGWERSGTDAGGSDSRAGLSARRPGLLGALVLMFLGISCVSVLLFATPGTGAYGSLAILPGAVTGLFVGLMLWRRTPTISARAAHVLLAAGTLSITAGLASVDGRALVATAGTTYIWPVVLAAAYMARRSRRAHMILVFVCYLGAVLPHGDASLLVGWASTMVTCLVVAGVVRNLLEQVDHMAVSDPLTGCVNRRALETELQALGSTTARTRVSGSLVVLDLDSFKALNDTLGHAAGDAALVRCARRWRAELRLEDVLARIGGDEFAIVLPGTDPTAARKVAQRLVAGVAGVCSVSYGVAPLPAGTDGQAALAAADADLYTMKRSRGLPELPVDAGDEEPGRRKTWLRIVPVSEDEHAVG